MLEGINILMVEDNLLNQKIVSYILHKQRAVVKMAINGKEAIDLILKNVFDVVLMDLQMPEMDGYSAIKFIREEMKNNVPIIALTAGLFTNDMNNCERIGANACISKPINPNGLCNLILNLIQEHQSKFKK